MAAYILGTYGGKTYDTGANKIAKKFRVQSSFAFDLIKTYKHFGHMVPIPNSMFGWAPKLYGVLTKEFLLHNNVKRVTAGDTYTCTNIPVLVALLIYLDQSGKVIELKSMAAKVQKHHHCKGSLMYTHKKRMLLSDFPVACSLSWVSLFPFQIQLKEETKADPMALHEFIEFLWYSPGQADSLVGRVREKVKTVTNKLEMADLNMIIQKGDSYDKAKDKSTGAGAGAEEEHKAKKVNPFLEKKQVAKVWKAPREERIGLLEDIRADMIAKAQNISFHMSVLQAYDNSDEEQKALDVPELAPKLAPKAKSEKEYDLGRLKFLSRHSDFPAIPAVFSNTAKVGSYLLQGMNLDETFDLKAKPTALWKHLETHSAGTADARILDDSSIVPPRKADEEQDSDDRHPTIGVPLAAGRVMENDAEDSMDESEEASPPTQPEKVSSPATPTQDEKTSPPKRKSPRNKGTEQDQTITTPPSRKRAPPKGSSSKTKKAKPNKVSGKHLQLGD